MSTSFAVIRVTDETSPARPVIFAELLFKPVLAWMIDGLKSAGIRQFYLLCRPEDSQRTAGCVPPDTEAVVYTGEEELPEELGGAVLLTRPVVLTAREVEATEKFAHSYGIPAVSLVDEDRAALGAYYLDQTSPEWVLSRLDTGESISAVLEQEGLSLAQFQDNGDAISLCDYRGLQQTAAVLRRAIIEGHMERGVNFLDPDSAMIGPEVVIGAGTVILPQVILRGRVTVGADCRLGPNTMITASTIGDETEVNASQITDSIVGKRGKIGPFAYLRPGCQLEDQVKVGDFVELKNASVGTGSKIPHLSYVGDAELGSRVNMGCGSITVNYDGKIKTRTIVGDGAFIGCNSNLVAPVKVGDGAYTAAGSTITDEVPAGALAIARSRQENKEGWAQRRRAEGKLK